MKRLLLLGAIGFCVLAGGEQVRSARAQVLIPYGTNVARVTELELNLGIEAIHVTVLPEPTRADVFHLAITLDAEYSLHEAAPFGVGLSVWWHKPLHHTGSRFVNFN